jgi:transcription initiation factor TFIIB
MNTIKTLNGSSFDSLYGYKLSNRQIEDLLLPVYDIDTQKQEYCCPECGCADFVEDTSRGIIFCGCGQVIIDSIYDDGSEKRSYDDDGEPARCGMVHNRLLPQSSLGTRITARGKLRKLQIWSAMPYKERSDNTMFKRIHEICTTHHIVRKIEDDAKILCKKVSGTLHTNGKNVGKMVITRGFNRAGIVAGCLFIACRRNDETRSTKEIASYFAVDEKDVNKGIRSLLTILDDDDIVDDIGTSKIIHFIKRKCDELQIQAKYANIAITIAKNIDRLNIASNHTTYSLAAASILLMADINGIKSITKKRLSNAFYNLSDVTIGKTYKQIKNLRNILTDNIKVNEIMIDVAKQKTKRIITKEVWDKMVQFGIDTSKYILEGMGDEYIASDNPNNLNIQEPDEESDDEYYDNSYNNGHDNGHDGGHDGGYNDGYDGGHDGGYNNKYDNPNSQMMITTDDIKCNIEEFRNTTLKDCDTMDILLDLQMKLNIINQRINQRAEKLGICKNAI